MRTPDFSRRTAFQGPPLGAVVGTTVHDLGSHLTQFADMDPGTAVEMILDGGELLAVGVDPQAVAASSAHAAAAYTSRPFVKILTSYLPKECSAEEFFAGTRPCTTDRRCTSNCDTSTQRARPKGLTNPGERLARAAASLPTRPCRHTGPPSRDAIGRITQFSTGCQVDFRPVRDGSHLHLH